jgi:hypothetical protein
MVLEGLVATVAEWEKHYFDHLLLHIRDRGKTQAGVVYSWTAALPAPPCTASSTPPLSCSSVPLASHSSAPPGTLAPLHAATSTSRRAARARPATIDRHTAPSLHSLGIDLLPPSNPL